MMLPLKAKGLLSAATVFLLLALAAEVRTIPPRHTASNDLAVSHAPTRHVLRAFDTYQTIKRYISPVRTPLHNTFIIACL